MSPVYQDPTCHPFTALYANHLTGLPDVDIFLPFCCPLLPHLARCSCSCGTIRSARNSCLRLHKSVHGCLLPIYTHLTRRHWASVPALTSVSAWPPFAALVWCKLQKRRRGLCLRWSTPAEAVAALLGWACNPNPRKHITLIRQIYNQI